MHYECSFHLDLYVGPVITMDKKIADFGQFFGEKSDFGGAGKDIGMEKSGKKKSAKNRRFFR